MQHPLLQRLNGLIKGQNSPLQRPLHILSAILVSLKAENQQNRHVRSHTSGTGNSEPFPTYRMLVRLMQHASWNPSAHTGYSNTYNKASNTFLLNYYKMACVCVYVPYIDECPRPLEKFLFY